MYQPEPYCFFETPPKRYPSEGSHHSMYAYIMILISVSLKNVQLPLIQAAKPEISQSDFALYRTGRMMLMLHQTHVYHLIST